MLQVIHKTKQSTSERGLEFVLSDASIDRYGDTISIDGWDLELFRKNPICLFGHSADFPIGVWEDLSVRDGALRGNLRLAPPDTSPRIAEIHKLVDAGVLRACSVGFIPLESAPRAGSSGGTHFKRQQLVEVSLCAVPANGNALAVAKRLGISNATIEQIFRESKNATLAERVEYARVVTRRARETIARVEAKYGPKPKPKLLTMSEETKDLYARARASTARARAILAKSDGDGVERQDQLSDQAQPQSREGFWQGTDIRIRWRGHPVCIPHKWNR